MLLLDEPSNHLDLEATLWLENFLKNYPGTLVVISHERDLLNNVVDTILHLEGGKVTLYTGGYDSFERQRAERAAQLAAAAASQDAQRARLQDYIARNSARASTAKQAQSRAKMLAKMQPIAALADDPSLSFDFPSPTELRPPLITLDMAAVGYGETADPASSSTCGSTPTTASRCSAATATARPRSRGCSPRSSRRWTGEMHASGKMKVGYFTQYQVEELHGDDTPLQHMTRAMKGTTPGAVRAQLGRFGFSGDKAMTRVGKLSGGERARLALALITRDAPHLLILDEPTNHLDVDSREALVQALNGYDGAVILVSHDRHMVELTADRLVLVDDGTAVDYAGSIDDYIDFVLGRNQPKAAAPSPRSTARPRPRRATKPPRSRRRPPRPRPRARGSRRNARRSTRRCSIPSSAAPELAHLPMSELASRRAKVAADLEAAEARWIEMAEALEQAAA